MKVHRKALTLVVLSQFVIGFSAMAQMASQVPDEAPPKTELQKTLLKDHNTLSSLFDDLAHRLDTLLVGKKLVRTRNETKVILENSNVLIEGVGVDTTNNVAVNLRLPNTEKYWQLKFTNYDQQTTNRGVRGAYLKQNAGQRNYGATVGFFRNFENVQFLFRPRILLQDPLNISHSMSLETALKNKYWDFSPKLELFASPDKGTGVFTSLNTGYQIDETYSVTFVNEAEYQERFHLFTVTQGIAFGQVLDDISSLSYNLFFISTNQPNYSLDNFNVSVAYNAIVYKDIIDMQFIPGITFSKLRRWHGVSSLAVNFNIYF